MTYARFTFYTHNDKTARKQAWEFMRKCRERGAAAGFPFVPKTQKFGDMSLFCVDLLRSDDWIGWDIQKEMEKEIYG